MVPAMILLGVWVARRKCSRRWWRNGSRHVGYLKKRLNRSLHSRLGVVIRRRH